MTARNWLVPVVASGLVLPAGTLAQELPYAWFDIAFIGQDVSRSGTQSSPDLTQTVDLEAEDGNGIRFRASLGLWNHFFAFGEFSSADVDDRAVVRNVQGDFPASDEFDLTRFRAGVGYSIPLNYTNYLDVGVSYDSVDFDFGSFAGENFDADDKGVGAQLAYRSLLAQRFELGAHVRYTSVGDVDLSTGEFDADLLYGVNFAWTPLRAFSVIADYETGEIDTWAVGFRLGLDE